MTLAWNLPQPRLHRSTALHNHHRRKNQGEVVTTPYSSLNVFSRDYRKLPSLAAHLQIQAPIDNPALHQGRKRNTPHVEGQWAAYVYIPLVVSKQSKLFELLLRIFASARQTVPSLHPIGLTTADVTVLNENVVSTTPEGCSESIELHISLTRPVNLRAHQRDDFKRAVREVSRSRHRYAPLTLCAQLMVSPTFITGSLHHLLHCPS